MRIAILDGYVDEPSCLGVPPYIAPYPRYVFGMLKEFGINPLYLTIDEFRGQPKLKDELKDFDLIIIIAGIAVPGKYLGGKPLGKKELYKMNIAKRNILVGPIVLELSKKEIMQLEDCSISVLNYPFERPLYQSLCERLGEIKFDLDNFAVKGAEVVKSHPNYPNVICEIETYRGCYWGKCSFCIERVHKLWIRSERKVIAEIKALYDQGVRYFRLGRQTDFFTYLADFKYDIPKPNPERMKKFHRGIWKVCPKIKTLHLDNVNPKTLAEHPSESREIVKIIVTYQSPGNVAAMGLETADKFVIRKNTLCSTPEEVLSAIKLINEYGRAVGYNGLPYFLPGINFVVGLMGERKETFEENLEFLNKILENKLFLRRINIRQVKVFPGTPMESVGYRILRKHKRYFRIFKKIVREKVDNVMLRRIIPKFRKLSDLRIEIEGEKVSYARQLATYPILVGVVGKHRKNEFVEARVVGYGYRSITGVRVPLDPNKASLVELRELFGDKSAEIIASRPFKNLLEVERIVGNIAKFIFDFSNIEKLY